MTGTYFFTFLFLLSFLCFIKGNTKGKLCYLLKSVKVHFKREEKEQTHYCLDREGNGADADGAAREECGGDTLETHAPLTSGFFSREPPGPAWTRTTRTSLEAAGGPGASGLSGVRGSSSLINITRTALDTEETHPGQQGTL